MKKNIKGSVSTLLLWAGKDKFYLYLAVILSFISGLCMVVPYLGIYRIMDAIFTHTATPMFIVQNSVFVLCGVLIRCILFGCSGVASHKGAYNALFRVRCMVTSHMAKVPLGALNDRASGEIKTVLNENIEKLELYLAHQLPELVYYLSGPIAIFIYLLTVNVPLALISIIPLILGIFVMMQTFKKMGTMLERANSAVINLNSVMAEYIGGMRLIKAYNMGGSSFRKYSNAIEEENNVWNDLSRKMGPPFAAFVVLIECGILFVVPLGGLLFLNGSVTASIWVLFAFVGSLYLTEIRPLQELGMNFAHVLSAVGKVQDILDIKAFEGGKAFPDHGEIQLTDVVFSYNGKKQVLTDCNLHINNGEKIAIVGASGAGKSTVVQLVSRFYDVTSGRIQIGGVNIRDINYEQLLQNISIVFQKTFLSRGSVLENIRMGSSASLDEARAAAKEAQIDDFIMSLPQQYETLCGGMGTRFSGGEKQRIAIARAILKNAPVLILDEATSGADPENQSKIDEAIKNLCVGKTVIIVAHRLEVVHMCDRVAIMEDGRITFVGTHEQALLDSGYYQKAWQDYNTAREISYRV